MKKDQTSEAFFNDIVVESTSRNAKETLGVGTHVVTIIGCKDPLDKTKRVPLIQLSDRAQDFDGNVDATRTYPWKDEHTHATTILGNENGTQILRLKKVGFARYEEIPLKERSKYTNCDEGYAIDKKTGKRVISEKRSADCRSIISNFAMALGAEKGENPLPAIVNAFENKVKFQITVVEKEYNGETKLEISSFKALSATDSPEDEY